MANELGVTLTDLQKLLGEISSLEIGSLRVISPEDGKDSGRTSARAKACRAASTSITGLLVSAAESKSASRIVERSRIETASRKSCCITF